MNTNEWISGTTLGYEDEWSRLSCTKGIHRPERETYWLVMILNVDILGLKPAGGWSNKEQPPSLDGVWILQFAVAYFSHHVPACSLGTFECVTATLVRQDLSLKGHTSSRINLVPVSRAQVGGERGQTGCNEVLPYTQLWPVRIVTKDQVAWWMSLRISCRQMTLRARLPVPLPLDPLAGWKSCHNFDIT